MFLGLVWCSDLLISAILHGLGGKVLKSGSDAPIHQQVVWSHLSCLVVSASMCLEHTVDSGSSESFERDG